MSIDVKTENVKDATIQVHIAFENAGYPRPKKRRRAVRTPNEATLRTPHKQDLITGRNRAVHKFRSKAKRHRRALPAPKQISPA